MNIKVMTFHLRIACFRQVLLLLCLNLFILPCLSFAKEYSRSVSLEWGAVEGATKYEIRITRKLESGEKKKPVVYSLEVSSWEATVNYGKYDLELRSFDDRGVPGDWSPPSEFVVRPLTPEPIFPKVGSKVQAKDDEEAYIKLRWQAVAGAKRYKIWIGDKANKFSKREITSNTSYKVELPVAKEYVWTVIAIMDEGIEGEVSEDPFSFTHIGKQIEKPEVEKPISKFVKEIEWSNPEYGQRFNYALYRRVKKRWKLVEVKKNLLSSKVPFDLSNPSGTYRARVQAVGDLRKSSNLGSKVFEVKGGFRTPAAVEAAILKDSLNKPTHFYSIASYFISTVTYSNENFDQRASGGFNAVAGTGRIGLGYQDPESPWGTFGIADYGGINIDGENYTFASAELHLTWKVPTDGSSLLMLDTGVYSKEIPSLIGNEVAGVDSVEIVQNVGPHFGFKYWMPFSQKLGMQLNARAYYSLTGTAPNGKSIEPTLSYQVGALGSMRLNRSLMGYAGLAYRLDQAQYSAAPGQSGSRATDGDINAIELQGTYLNLILEYSF